MTDRTTSQRSRPSRWPPAACRTRPTRSWSGPPPCGRTASRCPCCRTASGGQHPAERTYAELLIDVHRYANVLHALGVRRTDGVALLAPNCDELVTATLAAQLAGIAAPINSGLSAEHIAELLRRSGARVLVAAGPDLAPEVWDERTGPRRRGRDGGPPRPAPDAGRPGGGGAAPDRRRAGRPPVRAGGGAATRRASWGSRPRPPTSPLSSTPAARRARRSSPRTPTPTRSATPG